MGWEGGVTINIYGEEKKVVQAGAHTSLCVAPPLLVLRELKKIVSGSHIK